MPPARRRPRAATNVLNSAGKVIAMVAVTDIHSNQLRRRNGGQSGGGHPAAGRCPMVRADRGGRSFGSRSFRPR